MVQVEIEIKTLVVRKSAHSDWTKTARPLMPSVLNGPPGVEMDWNQHEVVTLVVSATVLAIVPALLRARRR